jgi:hypothetical protein
MVQRYCRFSVQKDNAAAAVIQCQADAAAVPQVAMMRRVSAITQFDGLVFKAFEGHACSG